MTDAGELHKEKRSFARVPSAMIHDSRISSGALRCYAHMHWRYGQNHLNFEGRKSIATYLGVSETMVTRYLKELEAYGWIVVVIREPDQKTGQRKTPYYHVFEKRKASDIFRKEYACKPGETLRSKSKIEHRKLRSGKGGRPTHKEKTPEVVVEQGKESENPETQVYVYANSSSHGDVNSSSHGSLVNSSSPAQVNSSSHELDAVKDSYLDAKELKEIAADAAPEVLSRIHNENSSTGSNKSPSKPKRKTPHESEFDALAVANGLDPAELKLNKTAASNYWSVASDLHKSKFPVERIPALFDYCKEKARHEKWSALTVNALGKYAPDFIRDNGVYVPPTSTNGVPPAPTTRAASPGAPNLRSGERERKAAVG